MVEKWPRVYQFLDGFTQTVYHNTMVHYNQVTKKYENETPDIFFLIINGPCRSQTDALPVMSDWSYVVSGSRNFTITMF